MVSGETTQNYYRQQRGNEHWRQQMPFQSTAPHPYIASTKQCIKGVGAIEDNVFLGRIILGGCLLLFGSAFTPLCSFHQPASVRPLLCCYQQVSRSGKST
jgi:hypothetical protein